MIFICYGKTDMRTPYVFGPSIHRFTAVALSSGGAMALKILGKIRVIFSKANF